MKNFTVLAAALLIGQSTSPAAIDFTPTTGERILEGIKFTELYFHENGRKISFEGPRGWTYTGNASRIKFVPPDVSQAYGEIGQAPLKAAQNFDEATMKLLREQTVVSIPPDSHQVSVVSAEKNPLMISGRETYEVIVAYQLYGQQYEQGVLYMNLADTQVTFRFVARKADFDKLHRAFRESLCSWQSHDARPAAGVPANTTLGTQLQGK